MELQVFTNDCEWIIARDLDDARLAWCEHVGLDPAQYTNQDLGFEPLRPDSEVSIWCDVNGDPGDIAGEGCTLVTLTCQEWAKRGRGFLCSTEQ